MFETKALYQNDAGWKDVKLGNQNKETIGSWGCLLTSMAMVANGFGCNETPATLNEKLKASGGFQGALVIPAALPAVCPGLVFKGYQPCEKSPAPLVQIDAALAAGMPVIAQVDWSPNPGLQTHWVVIYHKDEQGYLIKDPYQYSGDAPEKRLYLLDRYKYSGKDPAQAITGVVWFEGQGGQPAPLPKPKPKVEVPKDTFFVYSTADGLALRSEPTLSGALIKRIPLDGKLAMLEARAKAEPKIGASGAWLRVQDEAGDQGYVAAWYVSQTKAAGQPEETAPVTGAKGFIVVPTTDGLAFRSQPVLSDATLIKRLPLNASLIVQEPEAQARAKIGVSGQWLQVKEILGQVGFVAAWYVTLASQPALGVREKDDDIVADQDEKLVLVTITEGVALRTQPLIADSTLIKRMPLAAELLPIEDGAQAKVGVLNQWINVRDIEGDEGFVAAWYVIKR